MSTLAIVLTTLGIVFPSDVNKLGIVIKWDGHPLLWPASNTIQSDWKSEMETKLCSPIPPSLKQWAIEAVATALSELAIHHYLVRIARPTDTITDVVPLITRSRYGTQAKKLLNTSLELLPLRVALGHAEVFAASLAWYSAMASADHSLWWQAHMPESWTALPSALKPVDGL